MLKRFLPLFLFFSLFLNITAMAQRLPQATQTTIQGKVIDLNTKSPIAKAEVVLFTLNQKIIASSLTDSLGKYQIRTLIPSGYYFLKVSKEGYVSQTARRLLQGGKLYTINFSLKSIPNLPPEIIRIQPEDNSTFLAGADVKIKVYAFDPNKDPLEYQFSIGTTIRQPRSSSNTYSWQTSTSDTGSVDITCEVRDNKGATVSKTITYRIINPTVEEILQKVVENYALINDEKMNVTVTSKFNNEPFGSTIYTRHYFKKPDRQRTDTFSNPDRIDSSKTEIQITIGPDIYIIIPPTGAQSHRNILIESNLTQEQLNQMDEMYHLPDFLNAHNLSRYDNSQDLTKGLVMIEAIPKTIDNIYSKLGLQIDYFKGLKIKSLTYLKEEGQDKLKQIVEIISSQKITNGAWIPKAQIKTLYFTEGNLVMTFVFKNIEINIGLPDYLFEPEEP